MKISEREMKEIDGYKAIRGRFTELIEQGSEGISCLILQDEKHISDDGKDYAYEGLVPFETGDILEISRIHINHRKEIIDQVVWNGILKMISPKNVKKSSYFTHYLTSIGDFKLLHACVDQLPMNVDLALWAYLYFHDDIRQYYGTVWKKIKAV